MLLLCLLKHVNKQSIVNINKYKHVNIKFKITINTFTIIYLPGHPFMYGSMWTFLYDDCRTGYSNIHVAFIQLS